MPPVPLVWKNSRSVNSQASAECATNADFDLRVLAPDALQREEEERLRELALGLAHAAGDVERENHRGVVRRALPLHELAEAQIVVGERRRIRLDRAALDRLLHGAAAVEPRAHAALVPAFAHDLRRPERRDSSA